MLSLSTSLTFFLAASKLDSCQVNQVHAVQVVVYEELQQVGDVALVRLVTLVHHGSALQQLAHSATNTDCSILKKDKCATWGLKKRHLTAYTQLNKCSPSSRETDCFWWRPGTTAVCLEIKDCYKLYLIKFSQQSRIILFLFALRTCSEDEREITEMSYHIFIKLHSRGQNVKDWLISTLPHCEIRNV